LIENNVAVIIGAMVIALSLSIVLSLFYPNLVLTPELLTRTTVGLDGLAFPSGAAATLSITTGVSSLLVGVMVAVALLPPTYLVKEPYRLQ
jgi:uncharacterized membrane protein